MDKLEYHAAKCGLPDDHWKKDKRRTKNPAAVELGKSGGLKTSENKTVQCRFQSTPPHGGRLGGRVIKPNSKQEERIFKIQISSFKEASKLIFMWVKSGDINVKQFMELNEANREAL